MALLAMESLQRATLRACWHSHFRLPLCSPVASSKPDVQDRIGRHRFVEP